MSKIVTHRSLIIAFALGLGLAGVSVATAQDCGFEPPPERGLNFSGARPYQYVSGEQVKEGPDPALATNEDVIVRDVARIRSPERELYEIVRYDAVNTTGLLRNCQFLWFWDIGGPPASRRLELRLVDKDADFPEADLLKRPARQPAKDTQLCGISACDVGGGAVVRLLPGPVVS